MTRPPKNGQFDLLLVLRVEPNERIPWECRVRLLYKELDRRGMRILTHRMLAADQVVNVQLAPNAATGTAGQPESGQQHPDAANEPPGPREAR